jgi:hypothetical protein
MRSLLAVTILLLLPGAAQARTVCGPSKARTLAANAEARLFQTGSTISGCSRGKRALPLGKGTAYKLAGRYAAVVRGERVTISDLRARKVTLRGTAAGRVRDLNLLADGHSAWLAGDGDDRVLVVDGHVRGTQSDMTSVALAGNVLLVGHGGFYEASEAKGGSAGTLARSGRVRLSARGGKIYAAASGRPRVLLGSAYSSLSSSAGGGVDRVWVAGTTVFGRDNRYGNGDAWGGEVHEIRTVSRATRDLCTSQLRVGDVVVSSGHAACVAVDNGITRIDADGLTLERFARADTTLDVSGGRLRWSHDGEAHTGPLPGATVCGPAAAKTLGQSPQARVYDRSGTAEGCADGRTVALGNAKDVLDVTMAGPFAAVHRRGESLTVYDLRSGQVVGKPVTAARMTKIALGDTGVGAYLTADGAGDTVTGAYPAVIGHDYLRVVGPLVVAADELWVNFHRAVDAPIVDGLVWELHSFALHVTAGRLMYRAVDLGPAAEVATVQRVGLFIAVLTTAGDLTVRRYDGTDVTRPCPSPVSRFTLDVDGRVTCG